MSHKFTAIRLVILGICMAAVLSGLLYIDQLAVSASLVDQTILFSDDFSGDLSQWSDAIGSWVIDQGELAGVGAGVGTGAWIYAGSTDWTDYFLQAKVIFVNDNAVLVARSRGHLKNEYRIDFWQQGGDHSNSYQVIKYQDDIAYDLTGGIVASPVPITNPSLIQVQLTNDHLLIYVNGSLVDNIVDSATLPKGRIGLGVDSTYSARFDNVVVSTMAPIVMLPPAQSKSGEADTTVDYSIELTNNTGAADSFTLQVLPGYSWATSLSSNQVGPILAGESITFTGSVHVPASAQHGDSDTALIQAASVALPALSATATLNTFATRVEAGVYLDPTEQSQDGSRGEVVTYQQTLSNHSGITDTFTLDVIDDQWSTQLSDTQVGPLADGESVTFSVNVTVPVDAPWYSTDNITIAATGIISPSLIAEAQITTTAFAPADITLSPTSLQSTQYTDELTNDTLTISNGAGVPLTYTIIEGTLLGNQVSPDHNELQTPAAFEAPSINANSTTCCDGSCLEAYNYDPACSAGTIQANTQDVPWLSVNPTSGSVPTNSSAQVQVTFNATDMQAGVYATTLLINSNDPLQPQISVPVTMTVMGILPGVDINPATASQSGSPGETLVYTFTVTNLGNIADTFTLTKSSLWTTTLSDASTGVLQPAEEFTFQASVTIPPEALDGTQDQALITATSTNDSQVKASAQATTTAAIAVQAGVDITPATASQSGSPGETFVYTFTLTNQGNVADSFTLTKNSLWTTTLSDATTGVLQPVEEFVFQASVTIPPDALDGAQDLALITATSTNDPQVKASAQATTTAVQIILVDVEILPLSAEKSGWPGETLVYTFTLTNLGNATDSFTLAKNSLWPATLSEPSTGTLQAGADFTFQLSVTVPPTALDGAQNTALVTATSANDPQVRASAQAMSTAIIPIYQVLLPVVYKPCPPPIFTDNFSDPTSGWTVKENLVYKLGYLSGEYQILVKLEGYIAWSWQDFGTSDFKVEVDARPVTHQEGNMGLMFSRNDQGFYIFEISDGQYSLWRVNLDPWTWTPLIDWTTSPVLYRGYTTNRLKVVRIQDSIALYANGVLLATVSDSTYTGTNLGMASTAWANNYDTHFDNFTLSTGCLGLTSDGITLNSDTSISGGDSRPRR